MNSSRPLPMLATLGPPPARYGEFAVEAKYDGQRGIAVIEAGSAALLSRNGADITRTFPEIAHALPSLRAHDLVVDGEIVALDDSGVPSFARLQQRWPQNRRPTAELVRRVPTRMLLFDVLRVGDLDVTGEPYEARRARLIELTDAAGPVVQVPGSWTGVDPTAVLAAVADTGLEGIVTKHLKSIYTPGVRSRDWIKTPLRRRSEVVVGGWLPGRGVGRHTVGALLVGAHDTCGALQFCGLVGSGLRDADRRRLLPLLTALHSPTSPFAGALSAAVGGARWVVPELVGDVEYREMRATLRHPSWKGLRVDIDAGHVAMSGLAAPATH